MLLLILSLFETLSVDVLLVSSRNCEAECYGQFGGSDLGMLLSGTDECCVTLLLLDDAAE